MTVVAELLAGYECRTEVMDSGHVIIGDEPETLGGRNKGPNPFALLQMSLANWTVVTLVGVAREKSLKLDALRVRVSHKQNIQVAGPHDPAQRGLKITELRRHIEVKGDLSQENVQALLWGAEHCPVSNSLEGAIQIHTRLEVIQWLVDSPAPCRMNSAPAIGNTFGRVFSFRTGPAHHEYV